MAQLAPVVLTDRKSTPVDHTFTPTRQVNGVSILHERTGVPLADPQLSLSIRESESNFKITFKLDVPSVQTETINGVDRPVIVHTSYGKGEFTFPKSTTEAERNDLVGMFQSILDATETVPNSVFVNLEGLY